MKRVFVVFCVIPIVMLLVSCTNSADTVEEIRNYVMESECESVLLPAIQLDTSNKTFSIDYDILASVIIGGTYEIEGDILVAKTYDENNSYLFKVVDSSMLVFIQEGSSKIELLDESIGIPITDGARFRLKNSDNS